MIAMHTNSLVGWWSFSRGLADWLVTLEMTEREYERESENESRYTTRSDVAIMKDVLALQSIKVKGYAHRETEAERKRRKKTRKSARNRYSEVYR